MSEFARSVPSGKKFLTGHPLFDNIIHLNYGTSVLMLDETFSEAQKLLHVLFENYGARYIDRHYEVVPYTMPSKDDHILVLGDQPLSDISINVNKVRSQSANAPIIHTALPDMIMKNEPDDILRLLMAWQKNIRDAGTVEFYILPKGTFQDLERKILAVVDGGIEIRVDPTESRFRSYIKPIRCCNPDAHLKEFQYVLDSGRLLIRLEDRFTDELVSYDLLEIRNRVEDYKKNVRLLKVVKGDKMEAQDSVYDYWMLSQIQDRLLVEIKELFPEEFDGILQKIATWEMTGALRVVSLKEPVHASPKKPSRISRRVLMALKLPVPVSRRLLALRTNKPRTIPADAALAKMKATLAFIDMLLAKLDLKESDYMDRLLEMQKRFSEIGARETALRHTKLLGQNASLSLDLDYLQKVLELTFESAYQITPKISFVSDKEYVLRFADCAECSNVTFTKPICSSIEGVVEGICGVLFKMRAKCREIECKALGDDACVFKLEFD